MPLQFETVAIPVTKGIDLRTAARLVEAPALLEAQNARFGGDGSSKRYGHLAYKALTGSYPANTTQRNIDPPQLTPYGAKILDSDWLFGWGVITGTGRTDDEAVAGLGPYPEPGYLFDGFSRDSEKIAWTGHSLVSYTPGQSLSTQAATVNPAVMPVLNSAPIAKTSTAQYHSDAADNGVVRVVVWQNKQGDAAGAKILYSAYDSITGAQLVNAAQLDLVDAFHPRVFCLSNWFHILGADSDGGETLELRSFQQNALTTIISRNLGGIDEGYYDVWKVDETKAAVVWVNTEGMQEVPPSVIKLSWIGIDGTLPDDEDTVYLSTTETVITKVACAVHPTTGKIGVAFFTEPGSASPDSIVAGVYGRDGALSGTARILDVHNGFLSANDHITIAPKYQLSVGGTELFDVYTSYLITTGGDHVTLKRYRFDTGNSYTGGTIFHQALASRAFNVGDRTFVWTAHTSTLQSTWFLLDEHLKPVGHLNFGTAATHPINTTLDSTLASVNFIRTGAVKDQLVYHLALGYKLRVATTDTQQGLFTEQSIQFVKLDFLPKLRTVQAGRATYAAGAQVWGYDGRELAEANFHIAPEATLTESNHASGALTATGTYSYRIDLCHKTAQNEEVRSHSFIVQKILTGANDAITLSIKTCLTRRADAYILIFRNAMVSGAPSTTWNLLNSRDPTSADFLLNTQTSAFQTYLDKGDISDTVIQTRELHPGNSTSYQHPFASPACEVIASGRDRVWVTGGELEPGVVYPSRLHVFGEVPSWNGNLAILVDRNEAPITAIGFVGDITAIFRERLTYIQEGDGPDNQANGFWPPARLALADTGAQSQESVALSPGGLLFQAPAGFRLLGPGGQLQPLGEPVDPLSAEFNVNAVVTVAKQSEVRWYGDTSTIVYNYLQDAWSTWTLGAQSVMFTAGDSYVTLVQRTGHFWVEDPDTWRDGDTLYSHKLRFPWLHAGQLGDFQRLKRLAGFGTWDPSEGTHNVRVELYYDERDFLEEFWEWTVPDATQNTDTWGTSTWGAGVWGDTASTFFVRDSVWRFRRMPRKQKCSVFSVSISDNNTDGPGFALVALGLELARKSGLDRIAVPGGTNVSR